VSVERVTILGTGRMEAAMVTSLRRAGFEVTVWNRTSSKAETVARETGALTAETAADVVAAADVVMSSLADDDAVRETYAGEKGAASGLGAGAIVAEMSTIMPGTVVELRPLIDEQGAARLDAPVSGSVAFAERGVCVPETRSRSCGPFVFMDKPAQDVASPHPPWQVLMIRRE
jgi:3-hydroxyisobutyrate dehydrogenase